jgi:ribonucleoside-diphosphate reductase beta chain
MSSIFEKREVYKPFEYPKAYEYYQKHEKMHWLADDVPMASDVADWKSKLNDNERHFLTNIFRFFTQGDCDVLAGYLKHYAPAFPKPEIAMMLTSFANREAVHSEAYSLLIDTIGLPETEYSAFMEFEAMVAKHEYANKVNVTDVKSLLKAIAVYSAFTEGLQLFSSFAMLLNFQRFNKMKGMCTIVEYSIKDENVHIEGMTYLFRTIVKENHELWTDDFKAELYQVCRDMVDLEDNFIDLAFNMNPIEGLNRSEVKQFVRFIADQRLLQLGLKANYGVEKNPLPWFDEIVGAVVHTNFFENRSTEYTKGGVTGDFTKCAFPKFGVE